MRLIKVFAKNYKGYKELDLDLNSINILIGKNGSGKSTITRIVPLIIASLSNDTFGPLNLFPYGIDIASSFSDLSHNGGDSATITLGASFEHKGLTFSFQTAIIFLSEINKITVRSFKLSVNDQEVIHLAINLDSLEKPSYQDLLNGKELEFEFKGLLPPSSSILNINQATQNFLKKATSFKENLSYLGPFRRSFKRVYQHRIDIGLKVGSEGEYAPYVLCNQDQMLNNKLGSKIKIWMERYFDGKYISIQKNENSFSLIVNNNRYENNIVDDGVGFSQVFPLLVDRLSRINNTSSNIEIIEQPELHLHPGACGVIADLYLTSLDNNLNTVILETHSRELLLRLRRRIAEKKSNKINERINIIYTCTSHNSCNIEYIKMNETGDLDWWPEGVFEESFDEILAIDEAKRC